MHNVKEKTKFPSCLKKKKRDKNLTPYLSAASRGCHSASISSSLQKCVSAIKHKVVSMHTSVLNIVLFIYII